MVLLSLYLLLIGSFIFEDRLFFKSTAREILAKQDITLKDDFKIKPHEIHRAIGDDYKTFTLEISAEDRTRLIEKFNKEKKDTLKYWQNEKAYFFQR